MTFVPRTEEELMSTSPVAQHVTAQGAQHPALGREDTGQVAEHSAAAAGSEPPGKLEKPGVNTVCARSQQARRGLRVAFPEGYL